MAAGGGWKPGYLKDGGHEYHADKAGVLTRQQMAKFEKLAENIQDSELYSYLVKTLPEGKEIIKGREKEEFEKWLGL